MILLTLRQKQTSACVPSWLACWLAGWLARSLAGWLAFYTRFMDNIFSTRRKKALFTLPRYFFSKTKNQSCRAAKGDLHACADIKTSSMLSPHRNKTGAGVIVTRLFFLAPSIVPTFLHCQKQDDRKETGLSHQIIGAS